MSNRYNDIVYDELADIMPDLTPEEQTEVRGLLDANDLETAWYKAVYYHKQHTKAQLRKLRELNGLEVF